MPALCTPCGRRWLSGRLLPGASKRAADGQGKGRQHPARAPPLLITPPLLSSLTPRRPSFLSLSLQSSSRPSPTCPPWTTPRSPSRSTTSPATGGSPAWSLLTSSTPTSATSRPSASGTPLATRVRVEMGRLMMMAGREGLREERGGRGGCGTPALSCSRARATSLNQPFSHPFFPHAAASPCRQPLLDDVQAAHVRLHRRLPGAV